MQCAGEGFIFYLDEPIEQPPTAGTDVLGWIVGLRPIEGIRVAGSAETPLERFERPDVKRAFPAFPHVAGFRGRAAARDVREGKLTIAFRLGGEERHASIALPPAPTTPTGLERLRLQVAAGLARRRLRRARSAAVRWNAGLRQLLAAIRLERGASFRRRECDRVLDLFARTFPAARLLQIGANDGTSGDPLVRWFGDSLWTGVLVEPVPHLANALAARYAGRPGLAIERAAIGESDGEATLYRIAEQPGDPAWFQQLATLDRAVLLKHPALEERIVEERIPTLSVATLLKRHALTALDLLVIDTEGYDYRILRQFDLQTLRPVLILFEHQHLSAVDRAAAYRQLAAAGYRHAETPEGDALAWRLI